MNDTTISSAPSANAASTDSTASSGKAATKPAAKAAPAAKTPAKAPRKTAAKAQQRKPVKSAKTAVTPLAAPAKAPLPKAADKKNTAAPAKAPKEKKIKVVRDSFTLPKTELLQITEMKKRAMTLGVEVKKSELIRAGLQALAGMADTAFKQAMANVPTIKTGRPAKD